MMVMHIAVRSRLKISDMRHMACLVAKMLSIKNHKRLAGPPPTAGGGGGARGDGGGG